MNDFDLTLVQQAQFEAWFKQTYPWLGKTSSSFEIALVAYKAAVYNSL